MLLGPGCLVAAPPSFEGSWEGAVVYAPGEFEVDFSLAIAHGSEGAWTGTVTIPFLRIENAPLQNIKVSGSEVSFDYVDARSSRTFVGTLDESGRVIRGTSSAETSKAPFEIERTSPRQAVRPALNVLSATGQELLDLFNQEQDKVRLLVILAPNCDRCKMGARLLQRHALDKIQDDRLRVYVLWQPLHNDDREAAERAAALVPDPRAKHFWIDNSSLSDRFKGPLGVTDSPVWDVYLAFAPGVRWGQEAPVPTWYLHLLPEKLPKERSFSGFRVHDELTVLLENSPR